MKIREIIEIYENSISNIFTRFEKIHELTKECQHFDGKNLVKKDYSSFSSLAWFRGAEWFHIDIIDENTINIFWYDSCDEYQNVYVSDEFFDDFDSYLEYVKNLVLENNKNELEKYNEYLRKLENEKEIGKQKQYEEFLKLKEIFEPQSPKSL